MSSSTIARVTRAMARRMADESVASIAEPVAQTPVATSKSAKGKATSTSRGRAKPTLKRKSRSDDENDADDEEDGDDDDKPQAKRAKKEPKPAPKPTTKPRGRPRKAAAAKTQAAKDKSPSPVAPKEEPAVASDSNEEKPATTKVARKTAARKSRKSGLAASVEASAPVAPRHRYSTRSKSGAVPAEPAATPFLPVASPAQSAAQLAAPVTRARKLEAFLGDDDDDDDDDDEMEEVGHVRKVARVQAPAKALKSALAKPSRAADTADARKRVEFASPWKHQGSSPGVAPPGFSPSGPSAPPALGERRDANARLPFAQGFGELPPPPSTPTPYFPNPNRFRRAMPPYPSVGSSSPVSDAQAPGDENAAPSLSTGDVPKTAAPSPLRQVTGFGPKMVDPALRDDVGAGAITTAPSATNVSSLSSAPAKDAEAPLSDPMAHPAPEAAVLFREAGSDQANDAEALTKDEAQTMSVAKIYEEGPAEVQKAGEVEDDVPAMQETEADMAEEPVLDEDARPAHEHEAEIMTETELAEAPTVVTSPPVAVASRHDADMTQLSLPDGIIDDTTMPDDPALSSPPPPVSSPFALFPLAASPLAVSSASHTEAGPLFNASMATDPGHVQSPPSPSGATSHAPSDDAQTGVLSPTTRSEAKMSSPPAQEAGETSGFSAVSTQRTPTGAESNSYETEGTLHLNASAEVPSPGGQSPVVASPTGHHDDQQAAAASPDVSSDDADSSGEPYSPELSTILEESTIVEESPGAPHTPPPRPRRPRLSTPRAILGLPERSPIDHPCLHTVPPPPLHERLRTTAKKRIECWEARQDARTAQEAEEAEGDLEEGEEPVVAGQDDEWARKGMEAAVLRDVEAGYRRAELAVERDLDDELFGWHEEKHGEYRDPMPAYLAMRAQTVPSAYAAATRALSPTPPLPPPPSPSPSPPPPPPSPSLPPVTPAAQTGGPPPQTTSGSVFLRLQSLGQSVRAWMPSPWRGGRQ